MILCTTPWHHLQALNHEQRTDYARKRRDFIGFCTIELTIIVIVMDTILPLRYPASSVATDCWTAVLFASRLKGTGTTLSSPYLKPGFH